MTDKTVVVLEVRICQDKFGQLFSIHDFQSPKDRERSQKWKGGGVRQIAHALLTEAARREAYTTALVRLTQEPDFLDTYDQASDETKTTMERQLAQAVQVIIHRTLGKMGPDIAKEILAMMVQPTG
jgi:hypothetical protein